MFEESTGAHDLSTALGKKDGAAWLEKVLFRVREQIDIDRLDRKMRRYMLTAPSAMSRHPSRGAGRGGKSANP